MRLHWDLTLGYIVRTLKSSTRLNTLEFKRGDAASLELVFLANSEPVLLQPGHAIRFALKPKGHYDGDPLVYTATFSENTTAKTYTAEPSFNTASLTVLFASPNAPDRVDLIGEFSLRNGDDTHGWQSSQTFNASVMNDVIRGQEGTPGAAIDAQQSWLWLLATLAAGANITLTPNHESRVLTLAALPGASGNGWSPVFGIVSDGERRVLQLTAWTGGSGTPPAGAASYLGVSGWVATAAQALDLRGQQGLAGADGTAGADATPITSINFDGTSLTIQTSSGQSFGPFEVKGNNGSDGAAGSSGWTPLFALSSDGDRRVLQLQGWTGGSGGTPGYEGHYVGASGLTPNLYEAVDLCGPGGADGINGSDGASGTDATPITSIDFDGSNLTLHTSTGQSFGPFYVRGSDGSNGSDGSSGSDGTNGWSPVLAVINDGDRCVLQLQSWSGGSGSTPGSEGYYVGPYGLTSAIYDAVDIRGAPGADGSGGGESSPITSIDFDGSNLTIQTSSGQSFGPFYVRGSDGSNGSDGSDATPITNIDFDGSNLTIYTSSGQSFGPFYVRGNDGPPGADGGGGGGNGADGANGWSPQLSIVLDGARRVLQLQSWVGGSGSTPGNEGYYVGPYGLTSAIYDAVDIGGTFQPLDPIDNVNGTASLSGSDTVDVTMLEAQIADLQTKLQQVLDRLRSHSLISVA